MWLSESRDSVCCKVIRVLGPWTYAVFFTVSHTDKSRRVESTEFGGLTVDHLRAYDFSPLFLYCIFRFFKHTRIIILKLTRNTSNAPVPLPSLFSFRLTCIQTRKNHAVLFSLYFEWYKFTFRVIWLRVKMFAAVKEWNRVRRDRTSTFWERERRVHACSYIQYQPACIGGSWWHALSRAVLKRISVSQFELDGLAGCRGSWCAHEVAHYGSTVLTAGERMRARVVFL